MKMLPLLLVILVQAPQAFAGGCENETLNLVQNWKISTDAARTDHTTGNLIFGLQENINLVRTENFAKKNQKINYCFKTDKEVSDANLGEGWLAPPNSLNGTLNGIQVVVNRTLDADGNFHTKLVHRGWLRDGDSNCFTRIDDVEVNLYSDRDGKCHMSDFTFEHPQKFTVSGKDCSKINTFEAPSNQDVNNHVPLAGYNKIAHDTALYFAGQERKVIDADEMQKIVLSCNDKASQERIRHKIAFFAQFIGDPVPKARPAATKEVNGLYDIFFAK